MPLISLFQSRASSQSPSSTKVHLKSALVELEKAVNGLLLPDLKSAIGGVLEILKIVDKAKRNQDGLQELIAHLRRLETAIVTPLLSQQHLEISPALKVRIDQLSSELAKFVIDWQQLKTAHRFSHRFIDYEDYSMAVSDVNRRIGGSLDAFFPENQVSSLSAPDNIQHNVARVEKHLLGREIQALPRANAAYNSVSRNNAPTCFEGTREGVLNNFNNWFISGSTFMYVLLGIAGVGKSTIAQTIAALVAKGDQLAASFFFSKYDSERSTSRTFFSSLAFQLAQHNQNFASRISQALQASPDAPHEIVSEQLRKLIIEPLQDVPDPTTPMLIVLDALDECDEEGATEILLLMLSQLSRLPFLKVFVTTRPEPRFTPILAKAQSLNGLVLHDIEASIVAGDIRRFLKYHLSSEEVEKVLPGSGWHCRPEHIDALVAAAGRLFIVASTCEKFIKDRTTGDPQHQLNRLIESFKTPSSGSPSPFAVLDTLYLQILEAAIPMDKADEFITERFQLVIGSIIALQHPLFPQSLAGLLVKPMNYVMGALRLLQSIIVSNLEDPRPRVYHPSFPDFITSASRCKQERFFIDLPKHHARLAGLCLDLMARLLKRNICDLSFPDKFMPNANISGLAAKIRIHIPPELVYACTFWAVHLRKSSLSDEGLMEKLQLLSFKHLLFWLEVLSLTGRMEVAYPSVQYATAFAADHAAQPELLTMLKDAQRFIMGSQEIIRISASHVYYSALPFTPSETMLYKMYEHEAKGSIGVLKGQDKNWDPLLAVLAGHSDYINSVALSPDGTRLTSGSDDMTVRLWDAATGTPISVLEGHSGSVESVAYSPSGSLIASASEDMTVRFWKATTGAPLGQLEGVSITPKSVVFSLNGAHIASGSLLWNDARNRLPTKLEGHSSSINEVVFSPDSTRLASASSDATVRLWDVATGACLATLNGHSSKIYSVRFSPDSTRLASASHDTTVRLWDAASGASLAKLEGHTEPAVSIAFSPDGIHLASGSWEPAVQLWNTLSGRPVAKLEGHTDSVNTVVFSHDGVYLASGSEDSTVRLWTVATGALFARLEGHSGFIISVIFSHNDSRLISGSHDKTMRLWDVITTPATTSDGHSSSVFSVAFSPFGTYVASGSKDNSVRLWSAATGYSIAKLEGHSGWVESVVFSPNGIHLASGSQDATIVLWEITTGSLIKRMEGHSDSVLSLTFSRDCRRLVSGSSEGSVRIWDAANGEPIATLEAHTDWVQQVLYSPDGSKIASGSSDCTIRLWNADTGALIVILAGHMDYVNRVVFSPDGTYLVSASEDDAVKVWNCETGENISKYDAFLSILSDGSPFVDGDDGVGQILWGCGETSPFISRPSATDLLDTTLAYSLSAKPLLFLRDEESQSYVVCTLIGESSSNCERLPLCWLPFGFVEGDHAWYGGVVAAGFGSGRVVLLDTSTIQLD